jgi:hypothetical protein
VEHILLDFFNCKKWEDFQNFPVFTFTSLFFFCQIFSLALLFYFLFILHFFIIRYTLPSSFYIHHCSMPNLLYQERASKSGLFSRASKRDKRRSQPLPDNGRRYHSLGRRDLRRERRQSGGGEPALREDRWRPDPAEQSAVATKSNDMFS